jgi:3-oxoacyl-[acyl-carrier protein] reductase
VTFGGAELAGFSSDSFDDHVKIFVPVAGERIGRDYTPRRCDPVAREIDIEFSLHGDGPATSWAKQVRLGDTIEIGGPRSSHVVPSDFSWYVLVGDETGLPAIGRRLEELPVGAKAIVFAIVDRAEDRVPLLTRESTSVTWIHRAESAGDDGERLQRALEHVILPDGDGYVWIACEARAARIVRAIFVTRHAVPAAWVKAAGYWRRGYSASHAIIDDSFVMEDAKHDSRKSAIVTGSSRGIGAAIARRLARDGHSVIVNYCGNEKAALALVASIASSDGRAIAVKANVSDPGEMAALFDRATSNFGGVDIFINNAGVMNLSPLADTNDVSFDEQIAVNVRGAFNGLRLAARHVRDGGRVVSLSSSVVGLFPPSYGVYAASKAAVEAMTRVLAKELAKRNISVNAIAPGPVETDLFMKDKLESEIDAIVGRTPFGRLGNPDDIAAAVAFLVGSDGAWITGQVLRANGGII